MVQERRWLGSWSWFRRGLGALLLALGLPVLAAVSVTINPTTATVTRGQTRTFTATVSGTQVTAVTWTVVEAGGGSLAPSGNTAVYTAPLTGGVYHVKATSTKDPTKSATATVTVPSVVVTISPTTFTLPATSTKQFASTVTGSPDTSVTWSVQEANGGTVSNGGMGNGGGLPGLYQAPTLAGTFHVKATSNADPTKSASATVTVTPVVTISVSPTSATVALGGTQSFTATVGGTANMAVTWSANGGSLSASTGPTVTWTAPIQSGGYTITATSQADPTKSASAVVNVPSTVAISISPTSAVVPLEASQVLTATVSGTANQNVSWLTNAGTLLYGFTCTGTCSPRPAAARRMRPAWFTTTYW